MYSQGVRHHTFSTKTAFDRICKLPKRGGRIYLWVYNPDNERRTFVRRAIMLMERVLRPFCWRLPESLQTVMLIPITFLYLIYQNLYVKHQGSGYVKYGWREAVHAARDRFIARYAHSHTEREVCGWFQEAGYGDLRCISRGNSPKFIPIPFLTATAVDGVRH